MPRGSALRSWSAKAAGGPKGEPSPGKSGRMPNRGAAAERGRRRSSALIPAGFRTNQVKPPPPVHGGRGGTSFRAGACSPSVIIISRTRSRSRTQDGGVQALIQTRGNAI